MNKNIVLCSDGTGNSGGKNQGTNVWQIFQSIDLHSHKTDVGKIEQVAFYDDGVGTQRFKLFRLLGGALGFGLSRNVRMLYRRLVKNFDPGDHIYLFGFSRGAFTIRTLGGLITECGILDRNHAEVDSDRDLDRLVVKAYKAYRCKYGALLTQPIAWILRKLGLKITADEFRTKYAVDMRTGTYSASDYERIPRKTVPAHIETPTDPPDGARIPVDELEFHQGGDYIECPDGRVPIRFVGVWDTVDAVGLPFEELSSFLNRFIYQFKFNRRTLSPWVDKACHALAIDDERRSFHPLIFDEKHSHDETRKTNPARAATDLHRIEQVWFSGSHSNVGGGYPREGMSLVALSWMIRRVQAHGLRFTDAAIQLIDSSSNIHDRMYDPREGVKIYYRYSPRDIEKFVTENCDDAIAKVHVSVPQRIALGTENYAPGNLPKQIQIVTVDAGNVGEDASSLTRLSTNIEAAYGNTDRLLDRVRIAVFLRLSIYYFGFVVTAWMLKCEVPGVNDLFEQTRWLAFLAWCPEWNIAWLENALSWLPGGADRIMIIIGVAGAVIYTIDSLLRTWMNYRFSEFWRKVPELSKPWWR